MGGWRVLTLLDFTRDHVNIDTRVIHAIIRVGHQRYHMNLLPQFIALIVDENSPLVLIRLHHWNFPTDCVNMAYELAVVILTTVACFSLKDNSVLAQSECTLVENTSDKCHSANYIKILEQEVHKGMERRIKLPGRQREIRWLCGSSEERTAWDTPANQLRIPY